jgi:hypothetical protein
MASVDQTEARNTPVSERGICRLAPSRHLGRADEARSACERALARLRTDQDEDATRDVAAEALLTIRGLSLGAAESLLRDAAFPADPFAP